MNMITATATKATETTIKTEKSAQMLSLKGMSNKAVLELLSKYRHDQEQARILIAFRFAFFAGRERLTFEKAWKLFKEEQKKKDER